MGGLFGTSGIRGIYNEDLTPERVLDISRAIGTYYGPKSKALIGWDCRVSSDAITSVVVGGLLSAGIDVDVCGYITTPCFQKYMMASDKYDFGLIITASHNPPQYNGIKLINSDGLEEYTDVETKIESILSSKEFVKVSWDRLGKLNRISNDQVIDTYVESLLSHLDESAKNRKYKIVFDFANCVSAVTIKYLVRKLKNVIPVYINDTLNGYFPNRPSEPKPDNLIELEKQVTDVGADFGIGFDGDGDRAIVVDNRGVAWWGDYLGTVIGLYLKETKGLNGIATPVTSSSVVDIVLEKEGIKVYRTKVGAKHIVRKMTEKDLLLGFEENGGTIYSPHVLTRDGGITTILTMNIISHFGSPLSDIMGSLPKLNQKKEKIRLVNRDKIHTVLKILKEDYEKKCIKIDTIDGVKLYFDVDEWVLVRPSGTEPIIRIFAESKTEEKASVLAEAIKASLLKYLESM